MKSVRIGIIGGSGLYRMDGLTDVEEHVIQTPFGVPSDAFLVGKLDGVDVVFLARHGRGHALIPGQIPFRANIYAMKKLGVQYLVSVSAVGSLREDIAPLDMVLPDQFIDMTRRRESTFFGDGAVAHVAMADPVCSVLSQVLADAHAEVSPSALWRGQKLHRGGTYVCIEGPAFSTRAESHWYRSMGGAVIGMTNMPEARLAREAEIAYATLALVTDWDSWNPHQACVTAEMAIANLQGNAHRAQELVSVAIGKISRSWPISTAHEALRSALVTPPSTMAVEARARLESIVSKYA
ncbi:MAG: S-methyl-5'-thioadenosine phosphorylase [Burkholderiaceae bacterium]|nr:S-methyl-5'-thioadenosine phosphorylase [Burkholderiaceae bacterium]MDZ4146631.1 S-methyl-5'-thioadenosine phosphorylase [Burkholderiales bacterium]